MFAKKVTSHSYGTPRFFFYLGLLTIGQTVFRPAFAFTISDWFFLISFLLTTSECLLRKNFEIKFPPFMILGLFLFTVGGIISSGFAAMPLTSITALMKYLYLIAIWFWLSTTLLQKPTQIKTAIVLWTSSAALSGLGALLQFIWGDIIPGSSPTGGRMTGFTEHMNDLGCLTSIALIPAIMMLTRFPKTTWRSIASWICVVLITAGLLLSVSMSGVLSLVASLLTWSLLSKLSLKNSIILSVSAVFFCAAISVQNHYDGTTIISRVYNISDDGFSSLTLQTRLDTYAAAWEQISENPFIGIGLGPNIGITETGYVVHNIFLLNWFESGLLGFLGILIILGAVVICSFRGIRDPKNKAVHIFGIALFSSFIAFLVLGIAQPIYYKRFGWISAALLLSLYSTRNKSNFRSGPKFRPKILSNNKHNYT